MEPFRGDGTDESNGWWNGLDRRTLLKAGAAGVTASALGTGSATAKSIDVDDEDDNGDDMSGDGEWDDLSLREQLKLVRKATKPYQRLEAAAADGFESQPLPLFCGHGLHWDNTDRYDDELVPEEPESLNYLVDGNRFVFSAPEYLLVTELDDNGDPVDEKPDLFNDENESMDEEPLFGTSEADGWFLVEDDPSGMVFWGLTVWVHVENPNGVFNPFNPNYADMPGCVE